METKKLRHALRVALKCTNANPVEISTAMEAISKCSPIVEARVARALSNAMSRGGADELSDEDKNLLTETLADLKNSSQQVVTSTCA